MPSSPRLVAFPVQTPPVARLVDARVTYRASCAVHALAGVSLTVQRGEFVAIVGTSGSGKSTLLSVLGTLEPLTSGAYELEGTPVDTLDDDTLSALRGRRIGFVFQSFCLMPRLSALQNVALPLAYRGTSPRECRARALRALERVGLADRSHHLPRQLSGGQQQRVAIARALVTDPSLILADEPTGALDSKSAGEVLDLFLELHEGGATVVLVTHDAGVASLAERRIRMADGRIASDETRPAPHHWRCA